MPESVNYNNLASNFDYTVNIAPRSCSGTGRSMTWHIESETNLNVCDSYSLPASGPYHSAVYGADDMESGDMLEKRKFIRPCITPND